MANHGPTPKARSPCATSARVSLSLPRHHEVAAVVFTRSFCHCGVSPDNLYGGAILLHSFPPASKDFSSFLPRRKRGGHAARARARFAHYVPSAAGSVLGRAGSVHFTAGLSGLYDDGYSLGGGGGDDDEDLQDVEDILESLFARLNHTLARLQALGDLLAGSDSFVRADLDLKNNGYAELMLLNTGCGVIVLQYTNITAMFGADHS